MADLAVEIAGIKFKNPVCTSSGTCGFGRELAKFYDLERIGGIFAKGTTLEPRLGNAMPRIVECSSGLLNAVGLQNPGIDAIMKEDLPWLVQQKTAVLVNIAGNTADDFAAVAAKLDGFPGLNGLELNISCPNVRGGVSFGSDPKTAAEVVAKVRKKTSLPIFVKLTPNVTDMGAIAKAVEEAGADALTVMNTYIGMVIDIEQGKPLLGNRVGGLCGPAIRPLAVNMVWQMAKVTKLPIVGVGGIFCAKDALEFFMAGATAVAIGSANMVNPMAAVEVAAGIGTWLNEHGYAGIHDIIGLAQC